jgi:formylglycine-generating enzyme required for sulfatase activity
MPGDIWYGDLVLIQRELENAPHLLAAALRLMPSEVLPWQEGRRRAPDPDPVVLDPPQPSSFRVAPSTEPSRGRFWRLIEREAIEGRPEASRRPGDPPRPPTPQRVLQPAPPEPLLTPWSRMTRLLEHLLRNHRPADLDLDRFVGEYARLRMPRRPPRRQRLGWAPRVWVLLDQSPNVWMFLGHDQGVVRKRLCRTRGSRGLRVIPFRYPPSPEDLKWCLDRLDSGTIIIHLGALGHYAPGRARDAWLRFGMGLRERGYDLAAILAVPRNRWVPDLSRLWNAEPWEADLDPLSNPSDEGPDRAANELLRLLSPAVRVEPGLLREVRLLLQDADVGTEADAWAHPAIKGTCGAAGTLDERWAGSERRRLKDHPDPGLVARAAEVRRRWRGHLPPSIGGEEDQSMAAAGAPGVTAEQASAARQVFIDMAHELEAGGLSGEDLDILLGYLRRAIERVDDAFWGLQGDDSDLREATRILLAATLDRFPDAQMPEGFGPADLLPPSPIPDPRFVDLWQVGDRLIAWAYQDIPKRGAAPVGTRLGRIDLVRPLLRIGDRRGPGWPYHFDDRGQNTGYAIPSVTSLSIVSDCERLTFEQAVRPAWARCLGWDRYGLWAEMDVPDVRYVMRWIPPGRFLQGSPSEESGRFEKENQREVTLTRGFWLGDAPVTQGFWTAVMGENPSRFRTDDRPVENVSAEDCESFLKKLRTGLFRGRGFSGAFPTEAQWEYACRAGATTATYAGDLVIEGARNASVLDPIAWYGGNAGVDFKLEEGHDISAWSERQYPDPRIGGTHPVRGKLPNAWGLYDMLGNVWEWCRDGVDRWSVPYPSGAVNDPVARGGPARVIRGGSWGARARFVRAASRDAIAPGDRGVDVGFRLSEDHGPS